MGARLQLSQKASNNLLQELELQIRRDHVLSCDHKYFATLKGGVTSLQYLCPTIFPTHLEGNPQLSNSILSTGTCHT